MLLLEPGPLPRAASVLRAPDAGPVRTGVDRSCVHGQSPDVAAVQYAFDFPGASGALCADDAARRTGQHDHAPRVTTSADTAIRAASRFSKSTEQVLTGSRFGELVSRPGSFEVFLRAGTKGGRVVDQPELPRHVRDAFEFRPAEVLHQVWIRHRADHVIDTRGNDVVL